MALSQSAPTANTHELSRVVITEPLGAPEAALKVAVAPIAPEPLLPLESAPVKLTTVMEAAAVCASRAVIATLVNAAGANARQISASPGTLLARATNCQVSPAPLTDVMAFPVVGVESVDMNASNNSFAFAVEKYCVRTVLVADE
jgi:DNA-binding transcriptional regulator YdaS (Cro superfamily)